MARFIQISLLGQTQEQQFIMNFYYRSAENSPDLKMSQKLCTALGFIGTVTSVGERMAAVMNTSSFFTSCIARDIVNALDYVAEPSAVTGTIPSVDLPPPFLAAKLTGNRQRADLRSTTHSMPLPNDASTLSGGALESNYKFQLEQLGIAMSTPIDTLAAGGGTVTWLPVTIKKERYTTPSGKRAYRIVRTETYLDANYSTITSFRVANNVTTQNSRKRGRGA